MPESLEILIADDNPTISKLYSLMLYRAGYQVRTAANGRETLAIIAQRRPDLLVLDYMMPFLTGIEVLSHLVRNPETASIPVLLNSATVTQMELASASVTRQMLVEILPKPVAMKVLLENVTNLLSRAQAPTVRVEQRSMVFAG